MLVSVIIPVYNTGDPISRCLNSVIDQTYKNLEIILINDGSTDQSGLMCDQYANKDSRVTVIHKKNGGVSSARNIGLDNAKGDYVIFIDPDDWIEAKMIERLYNLIKKSKAEISICGYQKENIEGTILYKTNRSKVISFSSYEGINNILNADGYKGYLWNKLFSVASLKENKIKFNEKIYFCEDLLFCCKAFLNVKEIVYDTTPYYHYIIHDNNITKTLFNNKKMTAIYSLEEIINLLKKEKNINIKPFINYYMHLNISLLMNSYKNRFSNIEIYKELKENLYKYKLVNLTDSSVITSCILGRINTDLMYYFWKQKNKLFAS